VSHESKSETKSLKTKLREKSGHTFMRHTNQLYDTTVRHTLNITLTLRPQLLKLEMGNDSTQLEKKM
jgi:hypothetical protein